jgi:hypothetical protein
MSPSFASPLTKLAGPSVYKCCALEEAELLAPSWSLNIAMAVQVVLIFIATGLPLYDYFYPRS